MKYVKVVIPTLALVLLALAGGGTAFAQGGSGIGLSAPANFTVEDGANPGK